jgi:DNA-binding MurR/RpiR family transcriptional regulator
MADFTKKTAEVAKIPLNNPTATIDEVSKTANVSPTTVVKVKQDLSKNGINLFDTVVKKDMNLVHMAQNELERRLKDDEIRKNMSTKEIDRIATNAARRAALFGGEKQANDALEAFGDLSKAMGNLAQRLKNKQNITEGEIVE